jgi:rhamnulokinase
VNAKAKEWDYELIEMLGYNPKMFKPLSPPGTKVGELTKEIAEDVGFNCTVILAGSHDTASAVLAIPTNEEDILYISSGTWSLMGIERKEPDCSIVSQVANFTNEGGLDYRFRYLKNLMGLWMIQSVRKEFDEDLSFAEICERAEKESITSLVDCNDPSFMAPENMIEAVRAYCRKTNQQSPESIGEIAAVIYNSLAKCYQETAREIEKITGRTYNRIHVIGGGSNAAYLNELTAKYTGKKVYAGPSEATAIGNVLVQMLYDSTFKSIGEARECVAKSFEIH